ncbi:MAG: hypothetical protein ACRDRB_09795, partial [Pseudonocardiaceae bacterium]
MVQPDAVLEIADHVFDLGVATVVGLQHQGLTHTVGDDAVVVIGHQQGQLGAGGGLGAAHDQSQQRSQLPEGPVGGLGHVGTAGQVV